MINCIIAGVGGQGTLLASKLIAQCALSQGNFVRTAETIGMAQRGGSVVSHVRYGCRDIHSPQIPPGQGDVLVAFEPCEAVRQLPFLKKDAAIIVNEQVITPSTATLTQTAFDCREMISHLESHSNKIISVDGEKICRQLGSGKVLNTLLLGVAVGSGVLKISPEEMETALLQNIKEAYREINRQAFQRGMALANATKR